MGRLIPLLLLAGVAAAAAAVITVISNEEKKPDYVEDPDAKEEGGKKKTLSERVYVNYDSFKNPLDLELIKNVITKHFEDAGISTVSDKCVVEHDDSFEYPEFRYFEEPCRIVLTNPDALYWCQQIYQLSHELTHFVIHEHNSDHDLCVKWIEETVCDAVSLYCFDVFAQKWEETPLGKRSPEYKNSLIDYRDGRIEEKKNSSTEPLLSAANADELKLIDAESESVRGHRSAEVLELYRMLTPDMLRGLVAYRDYTDGLYLVSDEYKAAFPGNKAVEYLCDISDRISAGQ